MCPSCVKGLRMRRLLSVLLVLICAHASAQDVPIAKQRATVNTVRMSCPAGDGSRNVGSAAYLGEKLVLGCYHVVRGGDHSNVTIEFPNYTNPSGPPIETIMGKVVAVDTAWDQSLVELASLPAHGQAGIKLASVNPKPGDVITFAGYSQGGSLKFQVGQFGTYFSNRSGGEGRWFEASIGVNEGYSGGPAISSDGTLYGNLHSATPTTTLAVTTYQTVEFLGPFRRRIQSWGQYQDCPNGLCPNYGGNQGGVSPLPQRPIGEDPAPVIPQPPTTTPPVTPPATEPTRPPAQNDDCKERTDKLQKDLDRLMEKLDKLAEGINKPPSGPPAPEQKSCECKPTKGCECKNDPQPTGSRRVVVIGDPKGGYYSTLKSMVDTTGTFYDGIGLYPPPPDKDAGTLPALYLFSNGVPVLTYRGTSDVYMMLSRIRDGEFQ